MDAGQFIRGIRSAWTFSCVLYRVIKQVLIQFNTRPGEPFFFFVTSEALKEYSVDHTFSLRLQRCDVRALGLLRATCSDVWASGLTNLRPLTPVPAATEVGMGTLFELWGSNLLGKDVIGVGYK